MLKQFSYEVIIRCVQDGAHSLRDEVISDLNTTLNRLDELEKKELEQLANTKQEQEHIENKEEK